MKAKYADVVRYLTEKGALGQCPVCKVSGWSLYGWGNDSNGSEELSVFSVTAPSIQRIGQSIGLHFFATSCENCGYIRTFQIDKFDQWAKENAHE